MIHDFNINRHYLLCPSQHVRINKATSGCLWECEATFIVLSSKHYWQPQEYTPDQGPRGKVELTHTHTNTHSNRNTHFHKYTLVHGLMWLDPSRFMSAPGTLSLVISLVLTVFWIKQVCLHTATCLNTPLMRLFTLGIQRCVLVWFSLHAMKEGGQMFLFGCKKEKLAQWIHLKRYASFSCFFFFTTYSLSSRKLWVE